MRGMLSGNSPRIYDENAHGLVKYLDALEESKFKLFQAITRNGFHPETGEIIFEDEDDAGLNIPMLIEAINQFKTIAGIVQSGYCWHLAAMTRLADEQIKNFKKDFINGAEKVAISAANLVMMKAAENKSKAEISEKNRLDNLRKVKKEKHRHLTTLFTKYIRKYAQKNKMKLNKTTHRRGTFPAIRKQVENKLKQDNFKIYKRRTGAHDAPSERTYKRHFIQALKELGYPETDDSTINNK